MCSFSSRPEPQQLEQRSVSADVIQIHIISARGVLHAPWGQLRRFLFVAASAPARARGALVLGSFVSLPEEVSRAAPTPAAWGHVWTGPTGPPSLLPALQQAPLPSNPPLARAGAGCIPHSLFTIFTPLSPRTFADLFDAL
jgi:hypothetical protein